jgi:hypothetical protein
MAVTVTPVLAGVRLHISDVEATADGDVLATVPHGLPTTPTVVILTQLISQALTALSAWAATTIDGTNVVCTKLASVGSGSAGAQLRVIAMAPHSLIS